MIFIFYIVVSNLLNKQYSNNVNNNECIKNKNNKLKIIN